MKWRSSFLKEDSRRIRRIRAQKYNYDPLTLLVYILTVRPCIHEHARGRRSVRDIQFAAETLPSPHKANDLWMQDCLTTIIIHFRSKIKLAVILHPFRKQLLWYIVATAPALAYKPVQYHWECSPLTACRETLSVIISFNINHYSLSVQLDLVLVSIALTIHSLQVWLYTSGHMA